MKKHDDRSTPCVIRDNAISYARRTGLIDYSGDSLEDCTVIESVRKLMALGLTTEEIEELDIRQPTLQAICELARLNGPDSDGDPTSSVAAAVDTTLTLIADQVRSLDLEIEMLNLRRGALQRRTTVLEKLAQSLQADRDDLLAA